jgi:hypothetical protein
MTIKSTEPEATDYLVDLLRYSMSSKKDKKALFNKWRGHKWSSDGMRRWALWQWREMVG